MFDQRFELGDDQEEKARRVLDEYQDAKVVNERRQRNLTRSAQPPSKEDLWKGVVGAVVTTRQRAGPDTNVNDFMNHVEFPLSLDRLDRRDVRDTIVRELQAAGLPGPQNGDYLSENYVWFTEGGAEFLEHLAERLHVLPAKGDTDSRKMEEAAAALSIRPYLKGIGPKQSRNFWQETGLTSLRSRWTVAGRRGLRTLRTSRKRWMKLAANLVTSRAIDSSSPGSSSSPRR